MTLTWLSCRETLKRLDDYLDRELSPDEMKTVRGHLKLCHACQKKFAFERAFTDQLRQSLQAVALPKIESQSHETDALPVENIAVARGET